MLEITEGEPRLSDIRITRNDGAVKAPYRLVVLDKNALKRSFETADKESSLCSYEAGKRSLGISLKNADKGRMLYVPLCGEEGWKAEVNGHSADIVRVGNLVFVPLDEGDNEISLSWSHPAGRIASGLGILGIISGAVWMLILWHRKACCRVKDKLEKAAKAALVILSGGVFIVLCLLPSAVNAIFMLFVS
jgi:hypothetical protein